MARAARVLVYRWNNSLQHCSTAVGGGATIRGGKLQWWAGPGCSVRHGALFRDEIMGWPGSGWRPRSPQPPCLQGPHPWPSVSVMYCYQAGYVLLQHTTYTVALSAGEMQIPDSDRLMQDGTYCSAVAIGHRWMAGRCSGAVLFVFQADSKCFWCHLNQIQFG